jgi:type IV pilus assembly protein PilW
MPTPTSAARRQRGFSLPELMIATAIGLVILAGMATLFVTNSKAQSEVEKSNRQVENGRFGIQLLTGDLRNAGFLSEFDPTVLATPATVPDPCTLTLANLVAGLPMHVQGYDNVAADTVGCISDVKPGTDVLVLRHTATCVAGTANCDAATGAGPYFQASLCYNSAELNSGSVTDHYGLSIESTGLDRHKKDCTDVAGSGTLAGLRRYLTHIYFIANNDKSGDGVPTLKRAELGASGTALAFTINSQVNGIEDMQLEYGIDTNNDGVADLYSAWPDKANGCLLADCAAQNWRNVVSVKMNLLARNVDKTTGYTDTKTYTLGRNANGALNTTSAANDNYKRHVFQSLVGIPNAAGRKAP